MDSSTAPFRPLRSSWLAGWTYAGGVLRIVQLDGAELFANAPSWAPGLLSAAPSPGRFVRRHVMPRVFRRIPAPAAPEPDLIPALVASLELERSRREVRP